MATEYRRRYRRGSLFAPVCATLLLLLPSCSSEKSSGPGDNGPRPGTSAGSGYALVVSPKEPVRTTTLTLIPSGFQVSDAKILWLIDNEPAATPEPDRFNPADFFEIKKGVSIQAKAVVAGTEVFSNTVHIKNAVPEVSGVKFLPEVFRPGDKLSVEAATSDLDGDTVTLQYAWTKNRKPAGTGKTLDGPVKRGDAVSVRITPFDGEDHGRPVDIEREIKNLPPVIAENRKFGFDGSRYTYQTKANDPDGDTLKYSLGSAPEGMTINSGTGLLQWTVPKEFTGRTSAAITVDDGNGGVANYVVNITIKSTQVK